MAVDIVLPAVNNLRLVHWANRERIHLVPRAKATSGYGGVLPVKGGISVSMSRLRQVLGLDRSADRLSEE